MMSYYNDILFAFKVNKAEYEEFKKEYNPTIQPKEYIHKEDDIICVFKGYLKRGTTEYDDLLAYYYDILDLLDNDKINYYYLSLGEANADKNELGELEGFGYKYVFITPYDN